VRVDVHIRSGVFACPVPTCSRSWSIQSRGSASGFVIAAAKAHIARHHLNLAPEESFCEVYIHNPEGRRG
jgi:hypothetical protein